LSRHTGAGGFACSSAVEINLSILGEVLDFFDEIIGFDADGSGNALRVGVIVAVAADVGDEHIVSGIGGQAAGEFVRGDAGDDVEETVLAVDPDAIDDISGESDAEDDLGGKAGGAQSAGDGA
jgi:hypothetical protein